jgi:hypothetical protein
MKKLFMVLIILCLPALVNAQVEVNRVIEDKLYQLELHPYFRLFYPDKAAIILKADHTIQAVNWTGTGDWTYTANSNRRILIQYTGEFDETGMKIYLNLRGRSNFLGRIWGTGFYAIGNPSDPDPAPVLCYFRGSVQ